MTRENPFPTARRHYLRHAASVERAGDSVGSNDPELANALYDVAGRLAAYANTFDPDVAHAPLRTGERVRVSFDNAVVTGVDEDAGVVRVGSARFYGGGFFDADSVSRIS